ncbi:MAG: hypothetical protein ACT4OO_07920 [Nitrospiraceae bacterium]
MRRIYTTIKSLTDFFGGEVWPKEAVGLRETAADLAAEAYPTRNDLRQASDLNEGGLISHSASIVGLFHRSAFYHPSCRGHNPRRLLRDELLRPELPDRIVQATFHNGNKTLKFFDRSGSHWDTAARVF